MWVKMSENVFSHPEYFDLVEFSRKQLEILILFESISQDGADEIKPLNHFS